MSPIAFKKPSALRFCGVCRVCGFVGFGLDFFFFYREVGRGRMRDKEVPGCKQASKQVSKLASKKEGHEGLSAPAPPRPGKCQRVSFLVRDREEGC